MTGYARDPAGFQFAAMLCLYHRNVADEVSAALRSAFDDQTIPPSQLIAVLDGPIPSSVDAVLQEFEKRHSVLRINHPECRGHGLARASAVDACQFDWIAILDADDISFPDRFEVLEAAIKEHPRTAVVGGGLTEFYADGGKRTLGATVLYPETPEQVLSYSRNRSPVGQATALLRVAAIREVGNYQSWFNNEDYYLWLRLIAAGHQIRNVRRPVLYVRTSPDQIQRRGGWRYCVSEIKLQIFSYENGTTTLGRLLVGSAVRFAVQVLMPNSVRQVFYGKVLRRR